MKLKNNTESIVTNNDYDIYFFIDVTHKTDETDVKRQVYNNATTAATSG